MNDQWGHNETPGVMSYEAKLRRRIRELESKYNQLLMAVEKKHPEETRHQTALRYIQEREAACHGPCQVLEKQR